MGHYHIANKAVALQRQWSPGKTEAAGYRRTVNGSLTTQNDSERLAEVRVDVDPKREK